MLRSDYLLNCLASYTADVESIQSIEKKILQLQIMQKEGIIKGVDIAINDLKRKEFEEKNAKY